MVMVESLSALLGLGTGTVWVLLAVLGCLTAGAVVRGIVLLRRPGKRSRSRWRSLLSWWGLFLTIVAVLSLGRPAVVLFMGLVSLIALRESLALTARDLYPAVALAAVGLYLWAWLQPRPLFMIVLPGLALGLAAAEGVRRLAFRSRSAAARAVVIAVFVAVVGPSFVVAVASLPPPETRPGEPLGWLVLLFLLTALNDICQAWWGRAFGAHPLAPELSPNKTWEGLVGGLATTLAAALLLAPLLTDYGRASPSASMRRLPIWLWPLLLGLLVSAAGVAGDLTVSWLKRRAGVKDAGDLLPGQGGLLDRIDSLAVTAPVYAAVTWLLWFAGR